MSRMYEKSKIWLTIDIEEISDTNFDLKWKKPPVMDYEKLTDLWMELCEESGVSSTCFVLGTFAKKYPHLIKRLADSGHEIASHGLTHKLVYEMTIQQWRDELAESKKRLEEIAGQRVEGYRSPSWSLPFEKRYYEILKELDFTYSSSYFPFKTYMYGQKIDKKRPFYLSGIREIPLPKYKIPFSGGFYLRALPLMLQKWQAASLNNNEVKNVIYVHPYELLDGYLMQYFRQYASFNKDFVLAFWSLGDVKNKIKRLSMLGENVS